MNLRHFEAFIAVHDTGGFSTGAKALRLTQSTVSQHIATLEEEVGTRLFDRGTRGGVTPTEAGKVVLRHARRIVAEAGEIPASLRHLAGLVDVTLRVGASNIPGNYLIPSVLPTFLSHHPGVSFFLSQGDSRDTVDRVRDGSVEVGIVGSRYDDREVEFTPFGTDRILLVVHAGHRFAKHGPAPVDFDDVAKEPYLSREEGSGTRKTIREALLRAGVSESKLTVRATLGSNEAIKQAIAGGAGVSYMSTAAVRREMARNEVAAVETAGIDIVRHFFSVRRKRRELSPQAEAFLAALAER